ncbi:MAG: pantothenate kinase [Dehalococcoidia bacterium]|nr:pantothenate kinase [Dehalococcoidia bacterium]
MLLAVDIGNTNIKLGLFQGSSLAGKARLTTDPQRTADEYLIALDAILARHRLVWSDLSGVIIGSVVPVLTETFDELLATHSTAPVVWVGPRLDVGVRLDVDNPNEVGTDRIANALAAQTWFGVPAIVVDFGTATTFDAVDQSGAYIGGAISPGLDVWVDALVARTAQLRRITITHPDSVIGGSTVAAMQAGAFYGYVGLVDGITRRMVTELGPDTTVIATGGLARLITPETPIVQAIDADLTLKGLRLIWERNEPASGEEAAL